MSKWLVCDYYLSTDGVRVNTRRAIPVRDIDYIELDASDRATFAVVGKKRYHPDDPSDVGELINIQPDAKLVCDAVDSLAAKIEAADEHAQKSADALTTAIKEVGAAVNNVYVEMPDPSELMSALKKA